MTLAQIQILAFREDAESENTKDESIKGATVEMIVSQTQTKILMLQ